MAKKKIDLGMIATLCAAVLGVIAIIMLALPAMVNENALSTTQYSVWEVVFGKTSQMGGKTYEILKFSFMNFLTYALVIAGIVCTVLNFLGKGGKYMNLIATVAYLIAGIFFFLTIAFTVPNAEGASAEAIAEWKELFKLGAGAIIGGICSILAAVASGYKAFIAK